MKNLNKTTIFLPVIFVVSTLFRIIPSYISGSLFSTDVWPLYRCTKILLDNPQTRIWDDKFFDGYNNHWPGVILSSTLYIKVTRIPVAYVYMYVYTIILSIGFLLTFYIVAKLFLDKYPSMIAISIAGMLPSILIFSSSPLKEVYAYPLFFLVLYLASKSLIHGSMNTPDYFLLSILGSALVLSHHLATYMLIGFLLSVVYVTLIYYLRGERALQIHSLYSIGFVSSFIATEFIIYYYVYGRYGMRLLVPIEQILIYLVYLIVIYGGFSIITFSKRGSSLISISVLVAILYLVLGRGQINILPGINVSSNMVFWYVIPILASLILIRDINNIFIKAIVSAVGLFVILNITYIMFGSTLFSSIFHRFANYTVIIVSMLAGNSWIKNQRSMKLVTLGVLLLTIISSTIIVSNIVNRGYDISYYWFYPSSEVIGFRTILSYSDEKLQIVGDDKVSYFSKMLRNVSPKYVLEAMFLKKSLDYDKLIIIYYENLRIGFEFGINTYSVKDLFKDNVFNRLYDNGYVWAFIYGVRK